MDKKEPYALVSGPGQLETEEHARVIKRVLISQIGSFCEIKAEDPYQRIPHGDVQGARYLVAVFDGKDNWLGTTAADRALDAAHFIDKTISQALQAEEEAEGDS